MPKPEEIPDINNLELNPSEVGGNIEIDKKPEGEVEKPELSPEEQRENFESEANARQQEIARLTESVEQTKAKVNEARENLGLPPTEEDPPSALSNKEELEKLQAEHETLANQQEKERLIKEEKEKILQEKIDELFKEFESLNLEDFASIFETGKTRDGKNMKSPIGELDPDTAKAFAHAFKEGMKLLPKILEVLPDLLKKFDEDLTKEAEQRVEQKLEAEQKEMERVDKKEDKSDKESKSEKATTPSQETDIGADTEKKAA